MLLLKAQTREKFGRQTKLLRKQGILPAVLYGEGIENLCLEVNEKEFEKIFHEAGESSLIKLEIDGGKSKAKKVEVLIHDIYRDPVSEKFLHIDFYHPSTKRQVVVEVPLVFEGKSLAVKDLGGLLLKEIQMIEVKGLAQNLPKEIKVDIEKLKTFEDRVLVEDLILPEEVSIMRDKKDIVALVVMPKEEKEEKEPKAETKEEEIKEEKIEEEE